MKVDRSKGRPRVRVERTGHRTAGVGVSWKGHLWRLSLAVRNMVEDPSSRDPGSIVRASS